MPNCSTPSSPSAWCAVRKRRTCACASSAGWKRACRPSIASCSAASTKAPGRRRPAAIPGSAVPMRRDLGLDPPERRIGLAAHDFAQGAGRARSDPRARRQGRRQRRPSPRVSCSASPRSPARRAGKRCWRAATSISSYARALDHPRASEIRRSPGADAESRGAAVAPVGHRDRGLAARSLHHLRQIHSCACCRSMRSTRRPARATAAPSFTAPSATTPKCSPPKPPADPLRELLALGEKHFATLADYPEARAFWWPRFVRIAQWFAQWDGARRAGLASAACGNPRRIEIPGRQTRVHALGHRRPHRARATTAATPSSTTRPAPPAPRSRCAPGWRRN